MSAWLIIFLAVFIIAFIIVIISMLIKLISSALFSKLKTIKPKIIVYRPLKEHKEDS